MPRHARLDAAGALHHVIIRGIGGSDLFADDSDRQRFVDKLGEYIFATGCSLYDPKNHDIEMFRRSLDVVAKQTGPGSTPETKNAYKLLVHAIFAEAAGNDYNALRMMEAAHKLAPKDTTV